MMKKRVSIEDEYMHYNADDLLGEKSVAREGRDFLSTIISILIILVLLGVLVLGGFFGYRYFSKDDTLKEDAVVSKKSQQKPISTVEPKERMYTEKEMYAIVQTLMEKMKSESKSKATKTEQRVQNESQNAEEEFVSTLQNFEEAFVEDRNANMTNISEDSINHEIVQASKQEAPSHQNQVVIQEQSSYRDNVDKISNQINTLVEEMQSQGVGQNSNYTKALTREVVVREDAMRIIVVRAGDTLSKIAKRAYGSAMAYDRIFEANPNLINNPNRIYVGQRLRVPLD